MSTVDLGLPQVFCPAAAAKILRGLGLAEMTECALRTRAYRRQVPFHVNGRRIVFTIGDLREIAVGEACTPQAPARQAEPAPAPAPAPRRARRPRGSNAACPREDAWRARTLRDPAASRRRGRQP